MRLMPRPHCVIKDCTNGNLYSTLLEAIFVTYMDVLKALADALAIHRLCRTHFLETEK